MQYKIIIEIYFIIPDITPFNLGTVSGVSDCRSNKSSSWSPIAGAIFSNLRLQEQSFQIRSPIAGAIFSIQILIAGAIFSN
jgi:hypothetical protein